MDRSCNATILEKVIEYLQKHAEFDKTGSSQEDKDTWDKKYVEVEDEVLFNLILVIAPAPLSPTRPLPPLSVSSRHILSREWRPLIFSPALLLLCETHTTTCPVVVVPEQLLRGAWRADQATRSIQFRV